MRSHPLSLILPASLACLLAGLAPLSAGEGTVAGSFLLDNLSARQTGMGGVYAATADNSDAMNSNPAGLVLLPLPEANFSYASGHAESNHGLAAYAHPLELRPDLRLAFGAGVSYFSAGNIDINSSATKLTQSFKAESDYAGMLSAAARIGRWVALGITPQYVRSTLVEQYTASALAVDLGAMVFPFPELLKERLILGAAAQNLGTKLTYKTVGNDLPETEALGLACRILELPDYGAFTLSFQTDRTLGEVWKTRLGGEYAMGGESSDAAFFLRGGYQAQSDGENFSLGLGAREKNLEIDYAFVSNTVLESTHRLTLRFRFGSLPVEARGLEKETGKEMEKMEREEGDELIGKPENADGKLKKEMPEIESAPEPNKLLKNESGTEPYKLLPESEGKPEPQTGTGESNR